MWQLHLQPLVHATPNNELQETRVSMGKLESQKAIDVAFQMK